MLYIYHAMLTLFMDARLRFFSIRRSELCNSEWEEKNKKICELITRCSLCLWLEQNCEPSEINSQQTFCHLSTKLMFFFHRHIIRLQFALFRFSCWIFWVNIFTSALVDWFSIIHYMMVFYDLHRLHLCLSFQHLALRHPNVM